MNQAQHDMLILEIHQAGDAAREVSKKLDRVIALLEMLQLAAPTEVREAPALAERAAEAAPKRKAARS